MKTVLKIIGLFLLACSVSERVSAQTFVQEVHQQVTDPKATYNLAFKQPNTVPCTLVVSARAFSLPISDSNGNTWVKAPGRNGLWYTTTCASGPNTVTFTFSQPSYFQAVVAEYSGVLVPDQISDLAAGSGVNSSSPFVTATAGDLLLGAGWNDNSNSDVATAGAGFTMRGDVNAFLQDSIQSANGPAISLVTYASADSWHQAIAAFKVSVPPPPPPAPVSVTLAGSLVWDDATPIQGDVQVQQQIGQNVFQVLTDMVPDATGNVSGTVSVDMTQSDPVTFKFVLLDPNNVVVAVMQQAVPKIMFQTVHGVNNFKIVVSKANLTLAAGTDPGVLTQ